MKLGIMGGTFDPIHLGHLQVAHAAIREAGLTSVLFLPDGDPPHKTPLTPAALRYEMVRLAIARDPAFWVSDMEIIRKGRTYTVDTLLALKGRAPDRELVYLIGSDTLFMFPSWRTAEKVAQLCSMLVALREGDDEEQVRAEQIRLRDRYGLHSKLLNTRGLPISSSQVRRALRQGQEVADLVPSEVAAYIHRHGLYHG